MLGAGQRLFARGDATDGIYCLVRGRVRITGLSESGHETILAILEPRQWFGEIAMFDNETRTHDVWVEAETTLLHVPQSALIRMLDEQPANWRHFGRLLTQKLRVVFTAIEDLVSLAPTARLARRLVSMAEGYGAWTDRSKRVVSASQGQLGMMLSLSRQTVNQSLRELEQVGAIRCKRGAVEILSLENLERKAARH